uniref:Uncharacterized protein n=1 Tax=Periophthalmus magnuspinnatus TaxID=409849 RepID=A0A3B4BDT2_9GOBI
MPGMVAFGRRWGIASDDLVFPGSFEMLVRVLWWIGTLILYTYHKGRFDCSGGGVLHSYIVGLLVILAFIIFSLGAIVYVSAQGTITNPGPRRSITALVYLRALLYLPELGWACLGAVWVSDDSKGCNPATVGAVIAAVVIGDFCFNSLILFRLHILNTSKSINFERKQTICVAKLIGCL